MDADAFVILFTVGNESGKSASGFLRPDFFPCDKLLCPCQIFKTFFSPEYDGPFPGLQGFCLWIAFGVVMRIPVEVKFGDAFFRRKDVCDKAGSQCHAEFNGIEILIAGIPDLVKNGKSTFAGWTRLGEHVEYFRVAGKPFPEDLILEFLLSERFPSFGSIEKLVQAAQCRHLRGLNQFSYFVGGKRAGIKPAAQDFPDFTGNEGGSP